MRAVRFVVMGVLVLALSVPAALAAGRVALVVGNSAYSAIGALPNPGNDAADVAAALGRLGFEVTTVRDADRVGLSEALRVFTRESAGADVSLVFYAGHGLEMDGVNYLVPVDAQLERDTDVRFEAVELDDVLAATVGAGLRIVILDACRNNPLARSMQRTGASRNVSRGSFGELDENLLGDETLVAYAAAAGTTAADGTGRNSPYTTALLEYLEQPLEIGILFREVRGRVLEETGGEQRPHEYASLLGEHYLGGARAAASTAVDGATAAAVRLQQENLFWESIRESFNPADFEAYLREFPGGIYRALATNRLAILRESPSNPPAAPLTDPAPRDQLVPVVFMFEYEPEERERFARICPHVRLTQSLSEANVLIFGHRGERLEVRDSAGGWWVASRSTRDSRLEFACAQIREHRDELVLSTVGSRSPNTDASPVPVVFLGLGGGYRPRNEDWNGGFTSQEISAFANSCPRVRVTDNLRQADFIMLNGESDETGSSWRGYGNIVDVYSVQHGARAVVHSTVRRHNMFDDMCEYFPPAAR